MNTDKTEEEREGEMDEGVMNGLSERIIGAADKVSNVLGCGFLEKVYENALVLELRKSGLFVEPQRPIPVYYDDVQVGEYFADLVVEKAIIVELKAINHLDDVHAAQCINYLKGTGLTLCLLLNFGKPRVEVKRFRR